MKMEFKFRTPGGNSIKKMPAWKYRELRRQIGVRISAFLWDNYVSLGLSRPCFGQAKITCTYIATSKRRRDFENLAFAFKPWLDELQRCGVLEGDDMVRIGEPSYCVEVGGEYAVRIEIQEV